jgi:p-aminobenzoyl-glutamate transporter AbgT
MHDATRIPHDARFWAQVVLLYFCTLAVIAVAVAVVWYLITSMHELRLDLKEQRAAHRTMLTEHTHMLVEHQRQFALTEARGWQVLADHQAQMRTIQEGR